MRCSPEEEIVDLTFISLDCSTDLSLLHAHHHLGEYSLHPQPNQLKVHAQQNMEVPANIMLSMLQTPTTHSAHSKLTQNKTLSSTTRLGSPKTSKQTASSSYTHQWLHFLAYQDHSSRIMAERKKPDPIEAILEPGEREHFHYGPLISTRPPASTCCKNCKGHEHHRYQTLLST